MTAQEIRVAAVDDHPVMLLGMQEAARSSGAGAVVAGEDYPADGQNVLRSGNPYLAFARAVGEYGSVIFIAGNRPMVSEIAPLLIVQRLEAFDYAGAAAIGLAMLAVSFLALLLLGLVQAWLRPGRRG